MQNWGLKRTTTTWTLFLAFLFFTSSNASNASQDKPQFRHICPEASTYRDKLLIHHIAVGQGDSTFVRTAKGTTILIDGGLPSRGTNEILPILTQCYKITQLDYILLTHFDNDHQGGLTEIIEAIPVKYAIYDPGDNVNGKNFDPKSPNGKYVAAAKKTRQREVPKTGQASFRLQSNDPTEIKIYSVGGDLFGGGSVEIRKSSGELKDDNAVSISLSLRIGKFDYFIGGDLTGGGDGTPDVESAISEEVGDIDVLHANHHGSKTSNNDTFLNALKPETVIISVGEGGLNNKYKLPSAPVLERMHGMPFIKNIFQTAKGESEARDTYQRKVKNLEGDIVLIAQPTKYFINGKEIPVDSETGIKK